MTNALPEVGYGAMVALLLVIAGSVWLGTVAQRVISKGSFLSSYFLGNRGLGVWTMALTATVQSGGTFMGFPSMVYSHGWAVALWIASYMIVPLTGFAVLGKRIAQVSRRTNAITVPDLFRGRFQDARVGLTASLLILFFLTFMMIAQFKAGALIMKLSWPHTESLALVEDAGAAAIDVKYQIGLVIFALTVVGYTLIGGFLASVWTDLFQSVLMFFGVLGLLVLTFTSPEVGSLENATRVAVVQTNESFINFSGYSPDGRTFLTPTLAVSFFFVWIFGGMASPASICRVMASKNTSTLRRSIVVLAVYNSFIYIPLICISMAARVVFPDLGTHSDEMIPRMALWTTRDLPLGSFWAGMILAAPFGAVMATVSSYLVVISSGVVHDVYQRWFRPGAGENELKYVTYLVMTMLGVTCWLANIHPVQYLQALVVFCTSGGAASFLVPAVMTAYWRRATAPGILAAMTSGAATVLGLFLFGVLSGIDPMIGQKTSFRPYYLAGVEPVVWGIGVSLICGTVVSLLTKPLPEEHVEQMFA